MKDNISALLILIAVFMLGLSVGSYHQKSSRPTCQSEFDQQVKSTSIEHGQDIPHKGKRPNRIVTECEVKR
jgi:hypothetical protein